MRNITPAALAKQRRISPLAYGLLAVWLAAGAVLAVFPASFGPPTLVFVLTGWLIGVMLHEYAHALMALRAGDESVLARGYLTLNPILYFKLDLSLIIPVIVLLAGGIGFPGGAVYLRDGVMRSKGWRSLVSLAGPIMTLIVVIGLSALHLMAGALGLAFLASALAFLALLQASAFILNMLPVPGFDGYGVIRPFLPLALAKLLRPIERWASLLVVAAIFGAPQIFHFIFALAMLLCLAVGIPVDDVARGSVAFFFWKA